MEDIKIEELNTNELNDLDPDVYGGGLCGFGCSSGFLCGLGCS